MFFSHNYSKVYLLIKLNYNNNKLTEQFKIFKLFQLLTIGFLLIMQFF